ncbi:hypothetical protein ACFWSJ_25570 [Streptomyces niveus]|uniref:hypothetical protein n=1 Tax=Streptomyces niveus TaxID=193462 RepID=UPI0036602A0B
MTDTEAAAALEETLLHQHIDRNREDLADERGPAVVGEWKRIAQLLPTTTEWRTPLGLTQLSRTSSPLASFSLWST